MYWLLVVTGSQRGLIGQLTDGGVVSLAPTRTFLDWYECWLDGGTNWWTEFDGHTDHVRDAAEPLSNERSP